MISRKTQPHVAQSHWIGSETTEDRSFLRVEEGSLSRTLAFDCGVWTQWHSRRVCREETERVNCNLIDRETAVLAWSLLTGHLFTVQRDDWCMVCMQDSVYVKFVSEASAGQGFRALHGWMYDGRNSTVSFPSRDHVLMILFFAPSFYAAQVVPDNTHTLCLGLPGWAGTRKVKPVWILLKQEIVCGSGISWAICKSAPHSRQVTTPAPHHSVFYRPDALPATQPTVSKHWRPTKDC